MKKVVILASVCSAVLIATVMIYRQTQETVFPREARDTFDNGVFTIYSLEGDDGEMYKGKNSFHGFLVHDSAKLSKLQADELRAAFYENAEKKAVPMMSFFGHYGIRAEKDGQKLDLAICFGCHLVLSYFNDTKARNTFSHEGRAKFNAIYARAGVRIDDSLSP